METEPIAAPGWYPCPVDPEMLRYFDGAAWTDRTAPPGVPLVAERPVVAAEVPPLVRQVPGAHVAGEGRVVAQPAPVYQPSPVSRQAAPYQPYATSPQAQVSQPYAAPPPGYTQPGYAQPGYAQPGYAHPGYTQPGYAQQGYQQFPAAPAETHGPGNALHWVVPVGRSGVSIAAGYIGLVALVVWAAGPLAVGMGVWGLRKARTGGHGSGRSVFAIVTGVIGTALMGLYLAGALL